MFKKNKKTKKNKIMSVQSGRAHWLDQVTYHTKMLEVAKKKCNYFMSATQPTMQELYDNIEKYFDVGFMECEYIKRFSIDGKQSWIEEKAWGKMAKITIKGEFYLDEEQRDIVEKYVVRTYSPDLTRIDFK
jgi:hypothetical protein